MGSMCDLINGSSYITGRVCVCMWDSTYRLLSLEGKTKTKKYMNMIEYGFLIIPLIRLCAHTALDLKRLLNINHVQRTCMFFY